MRTVFTFIAALNVVACQTGSKTAQSPPLFPQDLPVAIEPPPLQNFTLPRAPLLQTTLLGPRLTSAAQTDDFKQTPALLDVLWVVSNAGAMADERDRLAANVSAFTSVLTAAKVTWQIAVTSSDLSEYLITPDGGLHIGDGSKLHGPTPIITPMDPSFQQDFTAALTWTIQRDSAPSQTSIFASMKLALDAADGGMNAGLLRPGAALAVIAAANNDDESFGEVGYFARYLKQIKGAGNEELVTFSAFGGPTTGQCSPSGQEMIFGAQVAPTPRLQGLTSATGGRYESICDENGFGGALTQIAENIKTLRRYFPLTAPPNPSSIAVTVNTAAVASDPTYGWQYLANVNTLAFLGTYVPDPGADVQITYTVSLP